MDTLTSNYRKIEHFFGNLKFAVVIITLFAICLGYGTFMESYHGTEYANRLIYKATFFMLIQFCMFLSIFFATLIRLPPRKHLYGFYVIHSGLIIIFLGSFITYQSGIDGNITLAPNEVSRQIQLPDDEFKIQFPSKGKEVTIDLPFVAGPKDLDVEYEGIKLKTFLPFSKNETTWIPAKIPSETQTTSKFRIFNDNFGEFITLSLHPMSDFTNTLQLGPLNVHYMPSNLSACFVTNTPDGVIIWNGETSECISPQPSDIKKKKISSGKNVAAVDFLGQKVFFLPEVSPLPLNDKFEFNEKSPFRIFSKKLFEQSPHLFLFGKHVAYFNKETSLWEGKPIDVNQEVALPWMGFKVSLLEHRADAYATMVPTYVKPIHENSRIIEGDMKAIEVEIEGQTFWVTSNEPSAYNQGNDRIRFEIGKKTITLPYELVLDQFKMETDPGTSTPASFESYVTLFKGNKGSSKHHIFMNNPLKHEDMTFYQASYFQTQAGPYGSVLSVNFDPGRPWKYLGSLLLVLGSIWHYFLRRKHLAKPGAKNG
jgi:hypothetical protein